MNNYNKMEYIEVAGSYYEVGRQLGLKTKHSIQLILDDFKRSDLYGKIKDFVKCTEGKDVVDKFLQTTQTYCSNYIEELKGVADGAGVSFDDLFLFNIDHEFVSLLDVLPGGSHAVLYASLCDGCTNISMETDDGQVYFVHTEDINPVTRDFGLMVKFVITNDEGKVLENFVDFYVPGFLSGSKFGFNSHGVMMGHNSIVQQGINPNGIPRKFMCRSLCNVKNGEEAVQKLDSPPGMATSYSFQFVQETNDSIENTVLEAANSPTKRHISMFKPRQFYYRCNILQHLKFPCHPEESSVHRAAVLSTYVNRGDRCDRQLICRAISNTQDPNFPVYRNGKRPDYLATAAIGLFDVNKGILEVYSDKPSTSLPVHTFNIPQSKN